MQTYNFAPGPAMLPHEVIEQIRDSIFNWNNTQISPLEIGHRSAPFQEMLSNLENKLRGLLDIPNNYKVLFLHGGATAQFSFIPMNLSAKNKQANYIVTGLWSKKSINCAKQYLNPNLVFTTSPTTIPNRNTWQLLPDAAYTYYCTNETVDGIYLPQEIVINQGKIPLVVDATSSITSTPLDISKHSVIFASAQKNLGIAGITLVIVRDDLLDLALDTTPSIFNYKLQAQHHSVLNTAPTFSLYVMDLMVDWIIQNGGQEEMIRQSKIKSDTLYQCFDNCNGFYINDIDKAYRSPISISFDLMNKDLVSLFLTNATKNGLLNLQGHNLGKSIRACFYNAMPQNGVNALVDFMYDFAKTHG